MAYAMSGKKIGETKANVGAVAPKQGKKKFAKKKTAQVVRDRKDAAAGAFES